MKWKQIFENARKIGTFTDEDIKMAKSWPDSAVGDMLRSKGYNLPLTSDMLAVTIYKHDAVLEAMGCCFYNVVKKSELLPICGEIHNTNDEYREEIMDLINEAQEIYDRIQRMKPSKALIDELKLTVPPTASA